MSFESNVHAKWPDKAETILGLIRGKLSPDDFASVQAWVRQCYNEPSRHEKVACALNEVIEGYGVEAIFADGEYHHPRIVYINQGDTYATTLVYTARGWRVGSWGDMVESFERRNIKFS
jgi:hypothetical protein